MTGDLQSKIAFLSGTYEKLTGMRLNHRGVCNPREAAWHEFIKAGFKAQDLETVIKWLKGRIQAGKRNPECLKFQNLLGDPYRFEEELALAKAQSRNAKQKPTPREQVLAQARPVVAGTTFQDQRVTAKPVGEWIQKLREAVEQKDL